MKLIKNKGHTDHATRQAQHAQYLHVADQTETVLEIFDLSQHICRIFLLVLLVQVAYQRTQRQKPVGVRQHDQRKGRKKKSRRVDGEFQCEGQSVVANINRIAGIKLKKGQKKATHRAWLLCQLTILFYSSHVTDEINQLAAVTPLIVVPAYHFHESRAQLDSGFGIENGRTGIAKEVV